MGAWPSRSWVGDASGQCSLSPRAGNRFVPTRKGWLERNELSCEELVKFGVSSGGCKTHSARERTAPTGSEPCDGRGNATGDAQAREHAGRGTAATKFTRSYGGR